MSVSFSGISNANFATRLAPPVARTTRPIASPADSVRFSSGKDTNLYLVGASCFLLGMLAWTQFQGYKQAQEASCQANLQELLSKKELPPGSTYQCGSVEVQIPKDK
jgi:hypothetical protein